MKAMSFNNSGDSEFHSCLLSYLGGLRLELKTIHKIRNKVYFIKLNDGNKLILKGFEEKKKWSAQQKLLSFLQANGFNRTYQFLPSLPPFEYRNCIYSFIEYVKPHVNRFHYYDDKNRRDGLTLLREYHAAASPLTNVMQDELSLFNQVEKWTERFSLFKYYLPLVKNYVSEQIIRHWIDWAEWALAGLKANQNSLLTEKNTIIHGDVAHHNFLRKNNGILYLIDFDLISIAPPIIDYLQFANRIMPAVQYKLDDLWTHPELSVYQNNPAFIHALAFPADIFREWNRIIRENLTESRMQFHAVWKMSVENFHERYSFIQQLINRA
jgi:thiamine kinase-like enzyme